MRNKLWIVLLVALVAVFTLVAAGTALAAGSQTLPAGAAYVSPPPPPAGSHLVMSVSETFINQEDSGNVGYWALDNGLAGVKVWQISDGSFYVIVRPCATFTTFATVPSPNCDAKGLPLEKAGGTGIFGGWVTLTFTATNYTPKFGYLGTFNDGGTKADILAGWYDLQQGPNSADTLSFLSYFPGWDNLNVTALDEVYRLGHQTMVITSGGTTGNIVVTK